MFAGSAPRARATRRFWIEAGLACVSAVALLLTVVWHDWIELVFRVDPDHGNGTAEWLVVLITASATVASSTLAVTEWRRAHAV
jgi:hypothetical protein